MTCRRGLLSVLALSVLGAVFAVWRYPLACLAAVGRTGLRVYGFEEVFIEGRRGRIAYFRAGSGPPLVFLHGANDQAGTWVRVAPAFAKTHKVIVMDLPGHGDSAPAQGPLTGEDLFDGFEAVMQGESAGQPATLVGNSLGGWMALAYGLDHPERVAQVISVNGASDRRESTRAGVTLLPTTREEARQTMTKLLSPQSVSVPDFVLDDFVRRAPASPLARLMAQPPRSFERLMIDERLDQFHVPVTVVWGADDGLLSLEYARRVVSRIPGARLDVVPNCGHMPQRECPDQLSGRLRDALSVPR